MIADRFNDPAMLKCPNAYYADLQRQAPVFYSESMGAYMITGYGETKTALMNADVFATVPDLESAKAMANFSDAYRHIYESAGALPPVPTLLSTSGDRHRRYRSSIESWFNVQAVRRNEEKIDQVINELIDSFIDQGRVDLYSELCIKVPLYVICDLAGLPREGIDVMQAGADANVRLAGGAAESEESRRELSAIQAQVHLFFHEHVRKYRAAPADNLISYLIQANPVDGAPLTDQEIVSMLSILNVGGNETTTNGIAHALVHCYTTEGMEQNLRTNRGDIAKFAEEALRLDAPVRALPRWTTVATELGGVTIPRGSLVFTFYGAANRDDAQFTCPAGLDYQRKSLRSHLTFGAGEYYCVGAPLARFEIIRVLNRMLDRICDVKVEKPLEYGSKLLVWTLDALPVSFRKVGA